MPDESNSRQTEPAGPPLPLPGMEHTVVPARIGPYRILDVVANGGMGVVYKAEQENPRRVVALKIPRGGKLLSPEARERFLHEVRLVASLDHAGIVPVLETGDFEGTPWYTMPFVEGWSLNDFVATQSPNLARRVDLLRRAAEVVQALHARGLIHRDLKPENIMVDRHGDVRLLDFGLARATAAAEPRLTAEHSCVGSLQCMAPEQASPGKGHELTSAADVYALGTILHWLACGEWPYSVEGDREAVLEGIRRLEPPPPSASNSEIPKALDEVVAACLRKVPKARPQTAGDLAARLKPLHLPATPIPSRKETPIPGRHTTLAKNGRRARSPRAGWRAWALAALVLGFIVAGTATWGRKAASSSPPPDSESLVSTNPVEAPATDPTPPVAPPTVAPSPPAVLPEPLWPLYQQTWRALRTEPAHTQEGAVLVFGAPATSTTVRWRAETSGHQGAVALRDGAAAVFVPADEGIILEIVASGHVQRCSSTTPKGTVAVLDLTPAP